MRPNKYADMSFVSYLNTYLCCRLERKKRDKEEQVAYKLEQEIALWDPTAAPDDAVTTDPFKTLFVGRINYYTSENKIRREFESYGPIKTIQMVHDKEPTGKPKGYCFIEFEHERDMHCKYTIIFFIPETYVKRYAHKKKLFWGFKFRIIKVSFD